MIYAEKGNRVKQITEAEVQKYADQGYRIVDENNNVVCESTPTDLNTLKLIYKKHIDEIKRLNVEKDALLAEIQGLKAQLATAAKAETKADAPDPEPKKRKSSKTVEE